MCEEIRQKVIDEAEAGITQSAAAPSFLFTSEGRASVYLIPFGNDAVRLHQQTLSSKCKDLISNTQ